MSHLMYWQWAHGGPTSSVLNETPNRAVYSEDDIDGKEYQKQASSTNGGSYSTSAFFRSSYGGVHPKQKRIAGEGGHQNPKMTNSRSHDVYDQAEAPKSSPQFHFLCEVGWM